MNKIRDYLMDQPLRTPLIWQVPHSSQITI